MIDFTGVLDTSEKKIFALRALYQNAGYSRYKMSKFEEYDLYSRHKEFLLSDRIITFTDKSGKLMALKPDVTLSLIKNNIDEPDKLKKLCYNENVYRISNASDSFKEIMQTGLECIGAVDNNCITEVLTLAAKSLEFFGKNYVLEISNLDVVSKCIDEVCDNESVKEQLLLKLSEKNIHEISLICEKNGIADRKAELLKELVSLYGKPSDVISGIRKLFGNSCEEEIEALSETAGELEKLIPGHVVIDFSLTGDMNYYNGIVFNGFIEGAADRVLSGGQYDGLMEKMGKRSKAIGFAVYLDMTERFDIED